MLCRACFAGCLALAIAAAAAAQQIIQIVQVDVSGTISQIGNRMILVTTAANRTYTVALSNRTQVRVVGMAEPDVLAPGVFVRFIALVDRKTGRVQGKVDALTIFTPAQTNERIPGVMYPNAGLPPPGVPAAMEKEQPKIVGGPGAPGAIGGPQPPAVQAPNVPPPADGPGGGKTDTAEKFDIRGRVISSKAGRLIVMVPNNQYLKAKVFAELADNAKIAVDLAECNKVKAGDIIEVRGRQANMGAIEAMEVHIQLAEPLTNMVKKGRKPGKQPVEKPGKQPPEVAKGPNPPGPNPPVEPGQPPVAPPQPDGAAPKDDKAEKILAAVQLPAAELQGKPALQLALQGGNPETYTPTKPELGKNVKEKFGQPDSGMIIHGNMPGPDGQQKQIVWELWTYGALKLIVDETGTVRYYLHAKK